MKLKQQLFILTVFGLISFGCSNQPTTNTVSSEGRNLGPTNDLFKAASIQNGELIAKNCTACHSLINDGRTIVGPNLYQIVGAPIGNQKYAYSDALLGLKKTYKYWTIDNLYTWLKNPDAIAPKTLMVFTGLPDPQDRMDLIAYLLSLK